MSHASTGTLARESAARAAAFLVAHQSPDGSIYDWQSADSLFSSPRRVFQVWETTRAALALQLWLDELGATVAGCVDRAAAWLEDEESPEGMLGSRRLRRGWFYRDEGGELVAPADVVRSRQGYHYSTLTRARVPLDRQYSRVVEETAYCVETSAEYLRLLARRGRAETAAAIGAKQDHLRRGQGRDGGWSVVNPQVARLRRRWPSVTGFVLVALAESGGAPRNPEAALRFLADRQLDDGTWGRDWHYYGTRYYGMARILRALRILGATSRSRVVARAGAFLERAQRQDGSWYDAPRGEDGKRSTSAELQTALAMQALAAAGRPGADRRVDRAARWLIERQRADGSWDGGHFPAPAILATKSEDLFATTAVLESLRSYYDGH